MVIFPKSVELLTTDYSKLRRPFICFDQIKMNRILNHYLTQTMHNNVRASCSNAEIFGLPTKIPYHEASLCDSISTLICAVCYYASP